MKAKPFTIEATFDYTGEPGVIVAQGGVQFGYALFVSDGRLHFAIRNNSELTEFAAEQPLEKGATTVKVDLGENGRLRVIADGQAVVEERVSSLLSQMPADGLQVGRDAESNVGSYQGDAVYPDAIDSVRIKLN